LRFRAWFKQTQFFIKWFVLLPLLGGVLPITLILHYLLIPLAENNQHVQHTVIYWWLVSNAPLFVFMLGVALLDLAAIVFLWRRLVGFGHRRVLGLILSIVVMGSCFLVTYLDWFALFGQGQDLVHVDTVTQHHAIYHLGLDAFTASEFYGYDLYRCDRFDLFCEWQWSSPSRTRGWSGTEGPSHWTPPQSHLVVDDVTHELQVEVDGTTIYTLNLVSEE